MTTLSSLGLSLLICEKRAWTGVQRSCWLSYKSMPTDRGGMWMRIMRVGGDVGDGKNEEDGVVVEVGMGDGQVEPRVGSVPV